MQIREIKSADFEKFSPVYKGFLADVETAHPGFDENGRAELEEFIKDPKQFIALAFNDEEEVLGFVEYGFKYGRFRDRGSERCEVNSLYLVSAARGQGAGRKLMEHVMEHCRRVGVMKIYLNSGMNTPEAHGFYEKLGFNKYGYAFKIEINPSQR